MKKSSIILRFFIAYVLIAVPCAFGGMMLWFDHYGEPPFYNPHTDTGILYTDSGKLIFIAAGIILPAILLGFACWLMLKRAQSRQNPPLNESRSDAGN